MKHSSTNGNSKNKTFSLHTGPLQRSLLRKQVFLDIIFIKEYTARISDEVIHPHLEENIMRRLLGILSFWVLLCLCGASVAEGKITIIPPQGDIYVNEGTSWEVIAEGATEVFLTLKHETEGEVSSSLMTTGYYTTEDGLSHETEPGHYVLPYPTIFEKPGAYTVIARVSYTDLEWNTQNEDQFVWEEESLPITVKSMGKLPETQLDVPSQINPGDALTLTMPAEDSAIHYSPVLSARDTSHWFSLNYNAPSWEAGKTYTIPGEYTADEDVYTLTIYAEKPRWEGSQTVYRIIAGHPVLEHIYVNYSLTESTGMLKLLQSYGIISLKDPSASLITEADVAEKPRALAFWYRSELLTILNLELASGNKGWDYLVLSQKDADAVASLLTNFDKPALNKILPGKNSSLWSMYSMTGKTLKDFCAGLEIPVPAVPADPAAEPTDEPTSEPTDQPAPTTANAGALKYSLKGSDATVTAPKSKNAKSLKIPATIKVKGKTYKVTAIKASAFKGLKNLTKVEIGVNVKTIGKNAFLNCKKLKTITVKTAKLTTKTVGASAFKGINKKATFKCPRKQLKNYKKLFVKKGAPKTCNFK